MASRKKYNDSSRHRHVEEVMVSSSSSSSSEEEVPAEYRGRRNQYFTPNRVETESQAGQSTSKTEENPFNFKHFLKNGSQTNYQSAGARPKVYTSATPYNLEKGSAVYPCNRTELPDFVQDHLVIEQYYLNHEPNISVRDCPHSGTSEANVPKSLPDFLNDGPIHNRTTLSTESGSIPNSAESTERRLLLENERLQQELELAQKQINEKSEKIELLKSELSSKREVEHEEAIHLEKAMEQVEDNLKRSTRRAVNAESTISSLKKEIKSLTTEISLLRLENKELRAGITAGSKSECGSSDIDQTPRRVASDLRHAASSAEVSLRQLMFGVNSLRVLASALENMDRIEDRTKNFLPDYDEDNAAGPAL